MGEWQECELEDIAYVQTGPFGSQLKNEQYITGGTPVVTVEHVKDFRILDFDFPSVNEDDRERLSKYSLKTGDIVFTRVGSVDLSAYVQTSQDGWLFSSRMLRVRPTSKNVYPRFLSYYFQQAAFRRYIINIAVGATMPSINTEILKGVPISYPTLDEQKGIAEVLASLDDKIDLLHRQNKTLEALAETLFRHTFVDNAQDDWEDGTLRNLITLNYGKGLKKSLRSGTGYPVVGSSGVVDYHKEYLVEGPGIVIGRKGTLGEVIYLYENFFPIDTTYYVTPKEGYGLLFTYYLLKVQDYAEMNTDSAVPGLNRDIALSVEWKIPPKPVVKNFENQIAALLAKKEANASQIKRLENLRDTLLPKLMSGEIRVHYDEDANAGAAE